MARTVDEIQTEIIDAIQADPTLSGLTSTSAVAFWRLITRVVAGALESEEQINDLFKAELEQIAREAIPGTAQWLQQRVLEFQYDALNPQIVQVIDGRVTYATIDESLRIVTAVAVKEQANGRVLVKAAKDDGSGGLEPLTSLEKDALEGYLSRIGFVGIPVDTISQQADRVRVSNGTIYYYKEYDPAVVLSKIEEVYTQYLKDISVENFNGVVVLSEVIDAFQSVEGVADVQNFFLILTIRQFSEPVPGGLAITVQREAAAGYAIPEDTPGYTLADTLTLLPDDQIPNA